MKNIKPEGEAGSVDQDAAKEFKSISKVLHRERVKKIIYPSNKNRIHSEINRK